MSALSAVGGGLKMKRGETDPINYSAIYRHAAGMMMKRGLTVVAEAYVVLALYEQWQWNCDGCPCYRGKQCKHWRE